MYKCKLQIYIYTYVVMNMYVCELLICPYVNYESQFQYGESNFIPFSLNQNLRFQRRRPNLLRKVSSSGRSLHDLHNSKISNFLFLICNFSYSNTDQEAPKEKAKAAPAVKGNNLNIPKYCFFQILKSIYCVLSLNNCELPPSAAVF